MKEGQRKGQLASSVHVRSRRELEKLVIRRILLFELLSSTFLMGLLKREGTPFQCSRLRRTLGLSYHIVHGNGRF